MSSRAENLLFIYCHQVSEIDPIRSCKRKQQDCVGEFTMHLNVEMTQSQIHTACDII